jgi:hypothetical protein
VSINGAIIDCVVMKNNFKIIGLPLGDFSQLFSLDQDELREKSARRLIVDEKPGFPCRVSLEDAEIGETVILLSFAHHEIDSPYRASGPIFVREAAIEANLAPGEIPAAVRSRVLSVRAYDDKGMMVGAEVTPGTAVEQQIERFFAISKVRYLHLHNAGAGCYSCRVERA